MNMYFTIDWESPLMVESEKHFALIGIELKKITQNKLTSPENRAGGCGPKLFSFEPKRQGKRLVSTQHSRELLGFKLRQIFYSGVRQEALESSGETIVPLLAFPNVPW